MYFVLASIPTAHIYIASYGRWCGVPYLIVGGVPYLVAWIRSYLREHCHTCRSMFLLEASGIGVLSHSATTRAVFLWLVRKPGTDFPQIKGTLHTVPVLSFTNC